MNETPAERVESANKLIAALASHGRRFFAFQHDAKSGLGLRVAYIERDKQGKLWLHNEWNLKRIYISRYCAWRHFHHGGTLHAFIGGLGK